MRIPTSTLFLLLNAIFLISVQSAVADTLKWQAKTIKVTPTFEQKNLTVAFKFENTNDHAITIDSTKTSCGCTVASLDKKTYQPGETGEVSAVFDIGNRVGLQTKHISVFTNGSAEATEDLTLQVNIPQAVTLTPRVRTWKRGETVTEQTIEATIHSSLNLEITSLIPLNDDAAGFNYTIEESNKPESYTIKITPKSLDLDTQLRGRFTLGSKGDSNEILKKYPIYTFIR